jgi:polysaccharide export outer membrane protein
MFLRKDYASSALKKQNNKTMKSKFLRLLVLGIISSCTPTRNLVYFSDMKDNVGYSEEIRNKIDSEIQPDDLLSITVNSLNPESNTLFNNGVLQTTGSTSAVPASKSGEGYLVDKAGDINFPVLGVVKLAGLTKEEATNRITAEVKKSIKNPIVNIRYLNFRVTVVGEVNHPAVFTIANERISLIEALGLAGDLTPFGRRDNILIIREKSNIRSAIRIDLSSKSALSSNAFYLQKNDVIYVEPVKARSLQTSTSSFYLPVVSLAISVLSVFIYLLR